jgi:hypothetical protein
MPLSAVPFRARVGRLVWNSIAERLNFEVLEHNPMDDDGLYIGGDNCKQTVRQDDGYGNWEGRHGLSAEELRAPRPESEVAAAATQGWTVFEIPSTPWVPEPRPMVFVCSRSGESGRRAARFIAELIAVLGASDELVSTDALVLCVDATHSAAHDVCVSSASQTCRASSQAPVACLCARSWRSRNIFLQFSPSILQKYMAHKKFAKLYIWRRRGRRQGPTVVPHSGTSTRGTVAPSTAVPHGARCIVLQKNLQTIYFCKKKRKEKCKKIGGRAGKTQAVKRGAKSAAVVRRARQQALSSFAVAATAARTNGSSIFTRNYLGKLRFAR